MIKIHYSADFQYYFVVLAKNGQVLVTSETYTRKQQCKRGILSLLRVCGMQSVKIIDTTLIKK